LSTNSLETKISRNKLQVFEKEKESQFQDSQNSSNTLFIVNGKIFLYQVTITPIATRNFQKEKSLQVVE